jgi:hypothetical protein
MFYRLSCRATAINAANLIRRQKDATFCREPLRLSERLRTASSLPIVLMCLKPLTTITGKRATAYCSQAVATPIE